VFKQLIKGRNKLVKRRNKKIKKIFSTKILIAISALKLLEKKSWSKISIKEIFKKSKINQLEAYSIIKEKKEVLLLINNYFDQETIRLTQKIENSNNKDKIFEIIMTRFEILNNYRNAVIKLFKYIIKKPDLILYILPHLIKSLIIVIESTENSSDGIRGNLKVEGLMIIYLLVFMVWIKDDTQELEKTMAALDNHLNCAEDFVNLFTKR